MIIMKQNKQGFTLIEVLIVIAIIGMIVGLLLPNFNQFRQESRDQSRKTGVKAIVEALELYKLNQNPPAYPVSITNLNTGNAWQDGDIIYLKQTPIDPIYDTNSDYKYYYGLGATSQQYYLGVCLEDPNDPDGGSIPPGAESIFTYHDCGKWYYKTEP